MLFISVEIEHSELKNFMRLELGYSYGRFTVWQFGNFTKWRSYYYASVVLLCEMGLVNIERLLGIYINPAY